MHSNYRRLDGELVVTTVARLRHRIAERFPDSGLRGVARELESLANHARATAVAVVFLGTIERRVKRRRALAAIHELRSLVHIVDMHQLTKDPEIVLEEHTLATGISGKIWQKIDILDTVGRG